MEPALASPPNQPNTPNAENHIHQQPTCYAPASFEVEALCPSHLAQGIAIDWQDASNQREAKGGKKKKNAPAAGGVGSGDEGGGDNGAGDDFGGGGDGGEAGGAGGGGDDNWGDDSWNDWGTSKKKKKSKKQQQLEEEEEEKKKKAEEEEAKGDETKASGADLSWADEEGDTWGGFTTTSKKKNKKKDNKDKVGYPRIVIRRPCSILAG